MLRKLFLCLLCLLGYSAGAFAQTTQYTISGRLTDAQTGEALIGASVIAQETQKGSVADIDGNYRLQLPAGTYTLRWAYVGYQAQTQTISLQQNQTLNIALQPDTKQLQEVVVSAESAQAKLDATQMSAERITMQEMKNIPVIFGEIDIIKILQLKPGITNGGEGSSGLYVRGGGPDQNLVLLDDALVYNAAHLFGFFSVFNSDIIKDVTLYKGDFPAQFGGRLSSVLDTRVREGNKERFSATGGVGLISSRLTVEAPIQKGKSSILIGGRRTYFDVFTRLINQANEGVEDFSPIPDYYFYDLNAKLSFQLGQKDFLQVSGYLGRDVFGFRNDQFNFDFNWGNTTASARWDHIFSPELSSSLTGYYSEYQYEIRNQFDIFAFNVGSNVQDLTIQNDWGWTPQGSRHSFRAGALFTHHRFLVGRLQAGSQDGTVNFGNESRLAANEFGAYLLDDIEFNSRWRWNIGLRYSGFENSGQVYGGFEPRTALRFKVNERISLKAALARMYQYIHLVSNSAASLPTDIWYPSSEVVRPQISDQVAFGLSMSLANGALFFSNEYYYKNLQNQIDLRDGAQLFANPQLEREFVFGRGWSYGTEFYLEKKTGRTTGWLGYTLSWTWRQFGESNGNPAINEGRPFFPRYDRRHDISLVVVHKLSDRLSLSGTWVYNTGEAISLPTERFIVQNVEGTRPIVAPVYLERNGFRLPAYHRMDLGLVWKMKPKWGEADWTFSVYNLYNRRNAYFIYFREDRDTADNLTGFTARQVALFPIIPSVTYNFRF
ncbi:TonB-dependent receptor [Eisenibacter elegans]|uniref:TonB-dependent receptor n=1 Tax=Eisenibacter elegans TaxID=997 RepID=UPI00041CC5FB|nr:TonB-dependent receptor [Eisenibacter elegans]